MKRATSGHFFRLSLQGVPKNGHYSNHLLLELECPNTNSSADRGYQKACLLTISRSNSILVLRLVSIFLNVGRVEISCGLKFLLNVLYLIIYELSVDASYFF